MEQSFPKAAALFHDRERENCSIVSSLPVAGRSIDFIYYILYVVVVVRIASTSWKWATEKIENDGEGGDEGEEDVEDENWSWRTKKGYSFYETKCYTLTSVLAPDRCLRKRKMRTVHSIHTHTTKFSVTQNAPKTHEYDEFDGNLVFAFLFFEDGSLSWIIITSKYLFSHSTFVVSLFCQIALTMESMAWHGMAMGSVSMAICVLHYFCQYARLVCCVALALSVPSCQDINKTAAISRSQCMCVCAVLCRNSKILHF